MDGDKSGQGAELDARTQGAIAMLETACRIHTDFMVGRYLMANAEGRWDGAEKALRHRDLCSFYVAIFHGYADPEKAARENRDTYDAVHSATQKLTDHLDEVIGFPLRGAPDYDQLAPAFFKRFNTLAMEGLTAADQARSRKLPA